MSNTVYYVLCAVLAGGVLLGISMMSRVKSAVGGNALSALCTLAAIVLTLYKYGLLAGWMLWVAMALGSVAGLVAAYRVKMIQMPQAVAMLNGFGGAASALVAGVSLMGGGLGAFSRAAAGLALAVGMVTLAGSLVAAAKLHGLASQKPVTLRGHQAIAMALLLVSCATAALMAATGGGAALAALGGVCAVAAALFGMVFAIRVGGADMPITISLLNSLSGVAGAIAGMAVADPLLVAVGGIVGASGLLLTQVMCRSMNRNLAGILLGKTSAPAVAGAAVVLAEVAGVVLRPAAGPALAAVEPAAAPGAPQEDARQENAPQKSEDSPIETAAAALEGAKRVIIVPGYGMAVAQAQALVKRLADCLEAGGAEVEFAIHPVAGRMPGHMNVLLAEVDVPYEKLLELEEVNPHFEDCDAALVVGANDVVNPAANTAEGTPIYGMPILDADRAKHVVVCNYDAKPGYAGVENPLYGRPNTTLLLGDAKETLTQLIDRMR